MLILKLWWMMNIGIPGLLMECGTDKTEIGSGERFNEMEVPPKDLATKGQPNALNLRISRLSRQGKKLFFSIVPSSTHYGKSIYLCIPKTLLSVDAALWFEERRLMQ
jgi:hypothetical protein